MSTYDELIAAYQVRVFFLSYERDGRTSEHHLPEGETLLGRGVTCDLILDAAAVSRKHAWLRVSGGHVFLRDAGSTHGTSVNGKPLVGERELVPGDSFVIGDLRLALQRAEVGREVLSDTHQVIDQAATIVRPIGEFVAEPDAADGPIARSASERRAGGERRKVNLGRAAGERRSGRDRRGGRLLRLLSDISKTLVAIQPIGQVLERVVDLVFDVLPAERAFLLLRDTWDQPVTARVLRNRNGSVPADVSISRTVVGQVMRDRVAILAQDARYDPRLHESASIHAMNVRSFMCAPLWNRSDVIGVLYCDSPQSKQFREDDLEVFSALCNYAAVAIEQARLSQQLLSETKRRERLQRYHSPGVVNRILHAEESEGTFITQERDVTVMFCDIVGFTKMCEHIEPLAVAELLNGFLARMCDVIFEHDGTLDKFIGDAILAVFGAPFDQPDHAQRCVATALEMQRELKRMNSIPGAPQIRVRIAINSGRALTGDIGSPRRREFTVLGDVVNTASRLQSSVAQPDQIVISGTTRERLGDGFQVRSLGVTTPRGRDSEVQVFEVLG